MSIKLPIMKVFCLISFMMLFVTAKSQDLEKSIHGRSWYVIGDLLKNEKCLLESEKPLSKSSIVKFIDGGKVQIPYEDDFILTSDYAIKGNILKIFYTINSTGKPNESKDHYFEIKELSQQKYELTPVNVTGTK